MFKSRNKLLISGITVIILFFSIFVHIAILNFDMWRSADERNSCTYDVEITGLSDKNVTGNTTILVPIPATKSGDFLPAAEQEHPDFLQEQILRYILCTPESKISGPSFKNETVLLDKLSSGGYWDDFIAKKDGKIMMGFKTDNSQLHDIHFDRSIVVNHTDIFNPIYNGSLILYPYENLPKISMKPYGNRKIYAQYPTYESCVYLSDNLNKTTVDIEISITCYNDRTNRPDEYQGYYECYVENKHRTNLINSTGRIPVNVTLEQTIDPQPLKQ
ncbi:conserved hypothetical protein (plasmid) [Methanohalobium evestigatum Z-7303]|uniref:Uncharacterized protein n=2 Tax=Methanohalobium evestigatum TaxID=2322 RepID=D7EC21_METEZ|nr:conserved hypothetical protein [Methanohalobium evestigatum Z-7303]